MPSQVTFGLGLSQVYFWPVKGVGFAEPLPGAGPVARTLVSDLARWERVFVLNDRPDPRAVADYAARLLTHLNALGGPVPEITPIRVPLANPADFREVADAVRQALAVQPAAGSPRAFLTTPGTSTMAMVWTFLVCTACRDARLVGVRWSRGRPPAFEWIELS